MFFRPGFLVASAAGYMVFGPGVRSMWQAGPAMMIADPRPLAKGGWRQRPAPKLAAARTETSEDRKAPAFLLREGVAFHNGPAFTPHGMT